MSTLLELAAVRVEAGGRPLADGLTLRMTGPRAVIVGDAAPIVEVIARRALVTRGVFRVADSPLEAIAGRVGYAPRDAPLPGDLTPRAFVAWGARLGGLSPVEAQAAADRACEAAGLGKAAGQRLSSANLVTRRLTLLAQAAVSAPRLLLVEDPLAGLDARAASYVSYAVAALVGPRLALVTLPRFAPGSPSDAFARGADELALIENGVVVEQGSPAELAARRAPPAVGPAEGSIAANTSAPLSVGEREPER